MPPDSAIPLQAPPPALEHARPRKRSGGFSRFPMWAVLIAGYSTCGREFAYLGVAPLFIGEAYLGFAVLRNYRNWIGRFVHDSLRFRLLPLAIFMHLGWGLFEVMRGNAMGRSIVDAIRTSAFNYYSLYMVIGVAIGGGLTRGFLLKTMKWIIVAFAIRVVLLIAKVPLEAPANCAIVAVWIIAIWDELRTWKWRWLMLVMSIYPVFFTGTHGRGTMLGLVAGIVAVGLADRKRMATWGLYAGIFLAILLVVGPMIPGPEGGGPPLDPVVQVARVLASDHPDLAIKLLKIRNGGTLRGGYVEEADNLLGARGTASWREEIWHNAFHKLKTIDLKLMGEGHGTSIQDLTPNGEDIHTPHNISVYCIYYTGYIGLVIFFFLLFAMWYSGTQIRHPVLRTLYSATFWCTLLVAITGNYLESPLGAIAFYLWEGVLIGLDQKVSADIKKARRELAQKQRQVEDLPDETNGSILIPAYARNGGTR